ncbi:hypothetical protein CDL15_Pgr016315 [Punica granatum]|uniref:Uncharacterized protein n=1 Tax=Punica granatum TaxID=22663 RepID=A0A218W5R9_PUNGR|nr:hypothetical protein CDL15_Pgr016315 [Punica granatum]PKI44140.1 hypothetical protein CRG98_035484 [Punica granatum]
MDLVPGIKLPHRAHAQHASETVFIISIFFTLHSASFVPALAQVERKRERRELALMEVGCEVAAGREHMQLGLEGGAAFAHSDGLERVQ